MKRLLNYFGLVSRTQVLEEKIKRLEEELDEVVRICEKETAYARSLVKSAMLRHGMWGADQVQVQATSPEQGHAGEPAVPHYFRNVVKPLHVQQLEARLAEEAEYAAYLKSQLETKTEGPTN